MDRLGISQGCPIRSLRKFLRYIKHGGGDVKCIKQSIIHVRTATIDSKLMTFHPFTASQTEHQTSISDCLSAVFARAHGNLDAAPRRINRHCDSLSSTYVLVYCSWEKKRRARATKNVFYSRASRATIRFRVLRNIR
jgi:hypothetical protein